MSEPQWFWYHCMLSTYGSWLHGDERGFRMRHHREHVEGDYKHPPPAEKYQDLQKRSEELLKQDVVVIPEALRAVVGEALREKLEALGAQVLSLSVGGQHAHVQARMPFNVARKWLGKAKVHAWFRLRERGWKSKLWGKRGKELPIRDRQHQINVYYYVMRHQQEGAWVWSALRK